MNTLRTHVITWKIGERTGTFEVDSYPGEDYAAAADEYLAENIGSDAAIVSITRKTTATAWEDHLVWCEYCEEDTRNREGLSLGHVRCDECGNPRDPE